MPQRVVTLYASHSAITPLRFDADALRYATIYLLFRRRVFIRR